jgi:hypothetical protein
MAPVEAPEQVNDALSDWLAREVHVSTRQVMNGGRV